MNHEILVGLQWLTLVYCPYLRFFFEVILYKGTTIQSVRSPFRNGCWAQDTARGEDQSGNRGQSCPVDLAQESLNTPVLKECVEGC